MFVDFFNPPSKLKFKKFQKSLTFSNSFLLNFVTSSSVNGTVFLKAISSGRLSLKHLEAARKVIRRKMKKQGFLRAYAYPYVSITKKPLAVRMGKGKGAVEDWVFPIRPGRLVFEISNCSLDLAAEALSMAAKKLPLRCKVFVFKVSS
jgi:large subunit ribosomal protein L16